MKVMLRKPRTNCMKLNLREGTLLFVKRNQDVEEVVVVVAVTKEVVEDMEVAATGEVAATEEAAVDIEVMDKAAEEATVAAVTEAAVEVTEVVAAAGATDRIVDSRYCRCCIRAYNLGCCRLDLHHLLQLKPFYPDEYVRAEYNPQNQVYVATAICQYHVLLRM